MKRMDRVYQKVKETTNGKGLTAMEIADALGLSRANVSSDLNLLWKQGKIKKSGGRPVLFSPIEEKSHPETTLDKLAKNSKSLTAPIEQAKAAILYPPSGMHSLIIGETGVGKTMFSGLMHAYAIETERMAQDAPFVIFNCADYANNAQLLISQLFGVKKGAYTGADADRKGLIEKADGGILFLDEVHRLPPEGQEMLFTFIDQGIFRRLGETEVERTADVLIISATTENPDSILLKTFLRRIPMVIKLPSLKERGLDERFSLITNFFREESFRLGKKIHVSVNTIRAFLLYHCPNNIGQLKTDIQLSCAKAYADYISRKKENLRIHSSDLPHHVKEGLLSEKQYRKMIEQLVGVNHKWFVFHPDQEKCMFERDNESENNSIYENIERKVNELRARGVSDEELDLIMEIDIENYFTQYIRVVNQRINKGDLTKVIDSSIVNLAEEIVKYAEMKLNKVLSQRVFLGLAVHIQTSIERIAKGKKIINPQLNKVRTKYKKEFSLALECIKMIEDTFKTDLPIDEAGFLTMFFVLDDQESEERIDHISILVITHGSGGATAMVDVTNRILGTNYAKAIDMPLDVGPQEILQRANELVKKDHPKGGLLLLVDMGSLLNFGEIIQKETGIPVKVIPFVSTAHVIEATRKAMLGYSLEEVYQDVVHLASLYTNDVNLNEESRKISKYVIVTACLTGEGSALVIKNMLQNQLRFDDRSLEFIAMNLADREETREQIAELRKNRRILCVISNVTVNDEIPHYRIEDVLNLKAVREIQHLIDVEETYMKMGETLKYHLKHVDGEILLPDIRDNISYIESRLQVKIPYDTLIGTALHMCCMVDRLKGQGAKVEYKEKDRYVEENKQLYAVIKDAVKSLEEKYDIQITKDEICFIMNIFILTKH